MVSITKEDQIYLNNIYNNIIITLTNWTVLICICLLPSGAYIVLNSTTTFEEYFVRLVERRGTWVTWYPWYKGPKAQIFGKTWYKGLKSWLYQVFCTKLGTYRYKNRYFHRVKPYIGPKLGTKLYHIWYFDVPTLVPRKILQKKLGTRFSLVQISRVKTWYKKLFYKPDAKMPRCPEAQLPRCPDAPMPRSRLVE